MAAMASRPTVSSAVTDGQVTVAAWGGGTNSTALLIRWLHERRRLDLVMFADTGGELPETYAFRDTFFDWVKKSGVVCVTVQGSYKYDTLEQECLSSKTLPSLAYGYKRCSLKWKRSPQDVWCNNWQPAKDAWSAGQKVLKLIGYDAGERRRAKIDADEKYEYRYPLIEWGMGRSECIEEIAKAGLPLPGKSACFFCPASKKREILDLKERHPEYLERALAIEKNADLWHAKGLGRRFSWHSVVNQDERQMKFQFAESEEYPCDCYD